LNERLWDIVANVDVIEAGVNEELRGIVPLHVSNILLLVVEVVPRAFSVVISIKISVSVKYYDLLVLPKDHCFVRVATPNTVFKINGFS